MKILLLVLSLFILPIVNSQTNLDWAKDYKYSNISNDAPTVMKLDRHGSIYVLGNSNLENSGYFSLLKYNSAGNLLWSKNYGMPVTEGLVSATSMVIDTGGSIYIAGEYNSKLLTLKYNSDGILIWSRYYSEQGNDSNLTGGRIIISRSGSLIVSSTIGSDGKIIILKYDVSGNLIWAKKLNQFSRNYYGAYRLAEDLNSNIYVAGKTAATINTTDYLLIKLDYEGNYLWSKRQISGDYPGPSPKMVVYNNMIYIGGNYLNAYSQKFLKLVKYNSNGEIVWEITDSGTILDENETKDIIVDASSNVYITGINRNNGSGIDCVTLKYNESGDLLWKKTYDSGINNSEFGDKITLDIEGNVYVGGSSINSVINGNDYLILKYDNNGNFKWKQIYNGSGNSTDYLRDIAVDVNGSVYITGWTSSGFSSFTTLKYSQVIGIDPVSSEIPSQFSLSQNYPNPFNPATKIKFAIPFGYSSQTILSVYDILGREVAVLVNEQLRPGKYEVDWDASAFPSGVYFYKLVLSDIKETKKMVLVK